MRTVENYDEIQWTIAMTQMHFQEIANLSKKANGQRNEKK